MQPRREAIDLVVIAMAVRGSDQPDECTQNKHREDPLDVTGERELLARRSFIF
jgi:hypothetical protein